MQNHNEQTNGIMSKGELGFMQSQFSKERRDLQKTTGTLVGATALASVGGCLNASAQARQDGKNLAGATSRTLPSIPIKAVDGNLSSPASPAALLA